MVVILFRILTCVGYDENVTIVNASLITEFLWTWWKRNVDLILTIPWMILWQAYEPCPTSSFREILELCLNPHFNFILCDFGQVTWLVQVLILLPATWEKLKYLSHRTVDRMKWEGICAILVLFLFLWMYHQWFEKHLTINALKYLSPFNSVTMRYLHWKEAYDKNDKYRKKEAKR